MSSRQPLSPSNRSQSFRADSRKEASRRATLVAALDDVTDTSAADVELPKDNERRNYTIQILGTDLCKQPGEKPFTVYKVEITLDVTSWIIYRRYSQFHRLWTELKSQFGKAVPSGFPPKQILRNLSPHSVDRRHQKLQDWLKAVLENEKLQHCPAVQVFIQRGKEDTDFVPRQRSSTIESDIDMAGSLYKLSNGSWKQRWFVLRHGLLYKYASPRHKHPFGFYDMRDAQPAVLDLSKAKEKLKDKGKLHAFYVDVPEKDKTKRYVFATESEEVMKQWIASLDKNADVGTSKQKEVRVFGVPLDKVKDRDANGVPLFLSALLTFLETSGACQDPELFTHPPDEEIKRQIDKGKLVDLEKVVDNHHAVAGLILQYLHELPDPIIPVDFSDCFWGIFNIKDKLKRHHMITAFAEILPSVNRNVLSKLFSFLNIASKSLKIERLAKIFGRLVLRPSPEFESTLLNDITTELILHPGLWEIDPTKAVDFEGDEDLEPELPIKPKDEEAGEDAPEEEEEEEEPSPKKKPKRDKRHKRERSKHKRRSKKKKQKHRDDDDEDDAEDEEDEAKNEDETEDSDARPAKTSEDKEANEAPARPSIPPPAALVKKATSIASSSESSRNESLNSDNSADTSSATKEHSDEKNEESAEESPSPKTVSETKSEEKEEEEEKDTQTEEKEEEKEVKEEEKEEKSEVKEDTKKEKDETSESPESKTDEDKASAGQTESAGSAQEKPSEDKASASEQAEPTSPPVSPRVTDVVSNSELLKNAQRPKAVRRAGRPTTVKITVPAGAEPPSADTAAVIEEVARPAPVLTPKQQLMMDLNKVLGRGPRPPFGGK